MKLTLSKIIYFAIQFWSIKILFLKIAQCFSNLSLLCLTGNNSFIKLVWIGMNQDKLKVSLNVKLNNWYKLMKRSRNTMLFFARKMWANIKSMPWISTPFRKTKSFFFFLIFSFNFKHILKMYYSSFHFITILIKKLTKNT